MGPSDPKFIKPKATDFQEVFGPVYDEKARKTLKSCGWSEMDLLRSMTVDIKQKGSQKTMGNITFHNGRPDWEDTFKNLKVTHQNESIGVMFCGPKPVADALKVKCGEHS